MVTSWEKARGHVQRIIESKWFSNFILTTIFLNTIVIAMHTMQSVQIRADWYFSFVDNTFLAVYVLELLLKFFVYRRAFFKNAWNNLDFFIVLASFFEWVQFAVASLSTLNPKILRLLRVFRAIRALRVLRTISFLKNLQVIVNTLLSSIPALASIILLVFLVLYVFAIMGTRMFGKILPDKFGDMYTTVFTLFQLITLDDWFELYDSIRVTTKTEGVHPVFLYLFVYIVTETFIFVNLFTAVIVNNLEANSRKARETNESSQARPAPVDDGDSVQAVPLAVEVEAVPLRLLSNEDEQALSEKPARHSLIPASDAGGSKVPPSSTHCVEYELLLQRLEANNLAYQGCIKKCHAMASIARTSHTSELPSVWAR